jgi:ribose transport system substrate-binding protein
MKKRMLLALVLVLLVTAVFAQGAKETGEKDTYLIGISQPFMGHPIRKAGTVLIDAWLENHPDVEVIVTDGQLNASKQIADIEDLMAQQVDIILVAAHQAPTLVPVLAQAKEAGFPIIPFDRSVTDKSVQISEVLNDDVTAGKFAAELMVEGMGETGNIVILQGPAGNTIVEMRQRGFVDEIKKYPGIKIVDDQVANFQRIQAVDLFENMLQANPKISGVYCHNDEMALGVSKVLQDAGRDDVTIVGIDGQKDALEAIIRGELYGTVRKLVEFPISLDIAYEYLKTGEIEPSIILDGLKVDSENVDSVYDPDAVF